MQLKCEVPTRGGAVRPEWHRGQSGAWGCRQPPWQGRWQEGHQALELQALLAWTSLTAIGGTLRAE